MTKMRELFSPWFQPVIENQLKSGSQWGVVIDDT